MVSFCLLISLAAQPAPASWDVLVRRLAETDPRDPTALLEFGRLCEDEECQALALNAYEKVRRLGDAGPSQEFWCEASFRTARIELSLKQHEAAFARLREIVLRCPGNEAARLLLQGAESNKTREQVLLVGKGDECVAQGNHAKALELYEKAFLLAPETAATDAYVPRSAILGKLAECRNKIDDLRYEGEFLPRNRSIRICPLCAMSSTRGFLACDECGGTGKKEAVNLVRIVGGLRREKVFETCGRCWGRGYQGCGNCFALGYTSTEITPREQKALKAVAQGVSEPKLFNLPLAEALRAVEDALLGVKEGATLNYLRAMKPDYTQSQALRKAVGSIPPARESLDEAEAEWEKARGDERLKVSFLLNYACEFAELSRHFDMLRASEKPALRCLKATGPWSGETLSPELLAAFPESKELQCVRVRGTLMAYKEGSAEERKGYLTVEGEIPHGVSFFVWLPAARDALERLWRGPWRKQLEGLAASYPFDLGQRIATVPSERRVLLVGRFLRDPFGYPRNWFEVWGIEVGLSRSQDDALRELSEPIDISFPSHTPRQIAEILREWFDLEMAFDGVSDSTLVRCEARACPKGLLVETLARSALECDWYYKDRRVVLCPPAGNLVGVDMKVISSELQRLRRPETVAIATRLSDQTEPDGDMPDDPAGLRVVARSATRAMRYDTAARCFEALLHRSEEEAEKEHLARLKAKMRLFHELTAHTPVSRLVGARDIFEIVFQKPSGDLVQATVILGREGGTFAVQEAYGASFRVRPELVKKVTPVSMETWIRGKAEELESRIRDARASPLAERAGKLFLAALFAKTHGLTERGTPLLEEAAASDDLDAFLRRLFPERHEALRESWLLATGRVPASGPAAGITSAGATTGEPAATEEEPITLEVQPLPEGARGAELLALARRHALRGAACARRILEGKDAAEWRDAAVRNFAEAEKALARYVESSPGDPEAAKLRDDVAALRASCARDMAFFE